MMINFFKETIHHLEPMFAKLLWEESANQRRIHQLKWDRLCKTKMKKLGLKHIKEVNGFNLAFLIMIVLNRIRNGMPHAESIQGGVFSHLQSRLMQPRATRARKL